LVKVDDHPDQENGHEGGCKIVVLLHEEPEEHAEDEENVEWLDDLEDEQLYYGWLVDHHRPWAIGLFQMICVCLLIALFLPLLVCQLLDPITVVVYAQTDTLSVHYICHVPVGETNAP